MRSHSRKSTPEVKNGRVQKKNDWGLTPSYYNTPQSLPVVDRKRPGPGYRHLLRKKDICDFIGLLPDWAELSQGLNAIVLAPGEYDVGGYHVPGVVHVCAWEVGLWIDYHRDFVAEHEAVFGRLGVPCEPIENGYLCKFTGSTARAYQLLHILLHELGHHHDRMTTRSQARASRGEPYAEQYALRYEALIWDRYWACFGLE